MDARKSWRKREKVEFADSSWEKKFGVNNRTEEKIEIERRGKGRLKE